MIVFKTNIFTGKRCIVYPSFNAYLSIINQKVEKCLQQK